MDDIDLFNSIVTGLVMSYFNFLHRDWRADPQQHTHYLHDTLKKLGPCIRGETPACDATFSDAQCVWASEVAKIFRQRIAARGR